MHPSCEGTLHYLLLVPAAAPRRSATATGWGPSAPAGASTSPAAASGAPMASSAAATDSSSSTAEQNEDGGDRRGGWRGEEWGSKRRISHTPFSIFIMLPSSNPFLSTASLPEPLVAIAQ